MKKIVVTILIGIMSFSLLACGKDAGQQEGSGEGVTLESVMPESTENTAESNETSKAEEETKEPGSSSEDPKPADGKVIEAFLDGEVDVVVKKNFVQNTAYFEGEFSEGESYSFQEFVEKLEQGIWDEEEGNLQLVNYGNLKATQAPGNWYCLSLMFQAEYLDYMEQAILQEAGGKLYLRFLSEEFERTFSWVNEYGLVENGGSYGAGAHCVFAYAPDRNGDYQLLYRVDTVFPGWSFYEGDNGNLKINEVLENFLATAQEHGVGEDELWAEQTCMDGKYWYTVEAENDTAMELFELLAQSYDYTPDEAADVEAEIQARIASFGITEDILGGEGYDTINSRTFESKEQTQAKEYPVSDLLGEWKLTGYELEGYFEELSENEFGKLILTAGSEDNTVNVQFETSFSGTIFDGDTAYVKDVPVFYGFEGTEWCVMIPDAVHGEDGPVTRIGIGDDGKIYMIHEFVLYEEQGEEVWSATEYIFV